MKIYLDYTQTELDRQYEHRDFVPDAGDILARQKTACQRIRDNANGRFDIAYGEGEDARLDLYEGASGGPAPAVVYFHGGRWSMGNQTSSIESAEIYAAKGVHFVSVNFSLLPGVTMDHLITQCRDAVAWLWRNAGDLGIDPARLFVQGKSSDAHIAAMMAVTDWQGGYGLPGDLFKGGLLVSGMYDLEPVRLTFRNDVLRLDQQAARRNSPIHLIPEYGCSLIAAVGGEESGEFRRQSRDFAKAWQASGRECRLVEVAGLNHFTMNDEMGNIASPMITPFLDDMVLAAPDGV